MDSPSSDYSFLNVNSSFFEFLPTEMVSPGFIEIFLKQTLVKLLTFRRMSFDQFINDSIPIIEDTAAPSSMILTKLP